MGLCLYGPRRIEISFHFAQRNGDMAIRETLLHEIAHALAGAGHGHDAVWKQKCLEIGATPKRLSFDVDMRKAGGKHVAAAAECSTRSTENPNTPSVGTVPIAEGNAAGSSGGAQSEWVSVVSGEW
jgi:hypothetical protein